MKLTRKNAQRMSGCALAYIVLAALLHWIVFPESPIPDHAHPMSGDEIHNPRARETVRFISTGQATVIEVTLAPGGGVPVAHAHPKTEETFTIKKGDLEAEINGQVLTLKTGDQVRVPPGTGHILRNSGKTDAVFEVLMRPSEHLNIALIQTHGYLGHGEHPPGYVGSFFQLLRFSERYDVYLAVVPIWLQKMGIFIVAPTARLLGFRSHDPSFTRASKSFRRPQ